MRVGIITDAFPPEVGGIQTFATQYVTQLSRASEVDHVEVLAFTAGADEERSNLSIRRVNANQTPAKLLTGLLWFHRHSFDVVHSLTLYPGGLIAALCSEIDQSVGTYSTVYGLDALSLADHWILGRIHRYIFDTLDEILFFSDSTRKKTHKKYSMDFPSRRIYPGVPWFKDTSTSDVDLPVDQNLTNDEFIVLTVARLVERKGINDLVTAVAELSEVELWVAGDGPKKKELERQVPSDADERITFLGEVSHDRLSSLYKRADLFCLPSVYLQNDGDIEGLGLVFLEAQQFGLPVIGTRSGGIPEALLDGETGFLVDERSPNQIRKWIAELHQKPEKYNDFSEQALEFVKKEFSWESCIQNHIDAYNSYTEVQNDNDTTVPTGNSTDSNK